ncbi:unnamed protein product [Anisakis simplex]|uniref:ARID domain-containing protein n=1 Tax=Anisakis simplex TaxID=6269 RepID=A0A0M3JCD6_ANISI|nr:unnamed protein product [Anisakis simplex]
MREPSQILSPGGMRMQMQQQQMGMCMPGRSPLGSPGSMHPPPSPYLARPPSNTSPSAGAPPYMQPQPPQGAAMHYGGNPMQSMQQQTSSGRYA